MTKLAHIDVEIPLFRPESHSSLPPNLDQMGHSSSKSMTGRIEQDNKHARHGGTIRQGDSHEKRGSVMFIVKEAGIRARKDIAIVYSRGRQVGGASVTFIEWMSRRVPEHQLSAEQMALIHWYEKRHPN